MKNIPFVAGFCLLVFASCQKSTDIENVEDLQKAKTLSVCNYEPEILMANNARKIKPTQPTPPTYPTPPTSPTPTPTPEPTPTPTPIPPAPTTPTGSGYSCILIDFDGQSVTNSLWNGGATLNCAPSGLSSSQITEVLNEVRALYAAYNVFITYDESVYYAANPLKRTRVVVTPTSGWYSGVSGIAYVTSFTWGDETPAFVFSDRLYFTSHYVAEIVAHEAGHTLGLSHQSEYDGNCTLVSRYRNGAIMGNSLNAPQGQWIYGTTVSCSTFQDDNSVLSNALGRL